MDPYIAGKPTPQSHHRRTQSETSFRFTTPEDLFLDDVVSTFNFSTIDLPSFSSDHLPLPPLGLSTHHRSLSVDSNFFNTTSFQELDNNNNSNHNSSKNVGEADRLGQLSLLDPKRAKRIIGNRQSAARSKERKVRYTSELEKKVQTLQAEATSLSAQVTKLQRESSGLTSENKELKLRLEAMEQHAHLRDALSEALREEVNHLKLQSGQLPPLNSIYCNTSFPPRHIANPNSQQLQPQPQNTQMPKSVSASQLKPSFMDFS